MYLQSIGHTLIAVSNMRGDYEIIDRRIVPMRVGRSCDKFPINPSLAPCVESISSPLRSYSVFPK